MFLPLGKNCFATNFADKSAKHGGQKVKTKAKLLPLL
jgi:hypothetical protein